MKINLGVALLAYAAIAQGIDQKEDAPCTNTVDCFINNLESNSELAKKFQGCIKEQDSSKKLQCILFAAEMKPEQIQVAIKILPAFIECSKEPLEKVQKCGTDCKDDSKKCAEKCIGTIQEEVMTCLAKKANLANFDITKSVECSQKCDRNRLSEFFNCDYKCKEELYKGLGAEMKSVTGNANRVQFGSLNLIAFALPLAYLFFN